MGSDLDLAIKGEKINSETVLKISEELNEETMIPLKFDVFDYNSISNTKLLDHIKRVGKSIYIRNQIINLNKPEENNGGN